MFLHVYLLNQYLNQQIILIEPEFEGIAFYLAYDIG